MQSSSVTLAAEHCFQLLYKPSNLQIFFLSLNITFFIVINFFEHLVIMMVFHRHLASLYHNYHRLCVPYMNLSVNTSGQESLLRVAVKRGIESHPVTEVALCACVVSTERALYKSSWWQWSVQTPHTCVCVCRMISCSVIWDSQRGDSLVGSRSRLTI